MVLAYRGPHTRTTDIPLGTKDCPQLTASKVTRTLPSALRSLLISAPVVNTLIPAL